MGYEKDKLNRKKRGNKGNKKSLRKKSGDDGGKPSYWIDLNPDHVVALIHAVTVSSGAVMLMRSSDGGALGLRIYHDDYETESLWGAVGGEIEETLENIWEEFKGDNGGENTE